MATIGLRKPYYARYNCESGIVTYSDGAILAKAIEFSAKIESSENNTLHADDSIAESDKTFSGGTMSITTDDLSQEASAAILGITPTSLPIGENTVQELIFDDNISTPYIGFGIIMPKKKNGTMKYRAVIFPRVLFDIPEDSAKTQEDKIEWQTPKIEGTIMRSEASGRAWKREATFSTEEEATAYIEHILEIKKGGI